MSPRFGRKSKTAETEPDAASTVVDENGEAVEEAARERLADDALQVGGDNEDATVGEAGGSGIALAHEFDGTDFQLSDEQLAEVIGQTSGDDAAAGLLGTIGDISTGKPGDDLFGSGEESGPPADPRERDLNANPFGSDPKQPGIDATDAVEAGVFDLIDADDSDPLSSFLDGAEAKLGRDSGLTTPADDAEDAPAYGTGMISDGYAKTTPTYATPPPGGTSTVTKGDTSVTKFGGRGTATVTDADGTRVLQPAKLVTKQDGTEVYTSDQVSYVAKPDGTVTTVNADGSTVTTKDGKVIDSTPPLEDPGPDGENAVPEEFKAQFDAEIARLRALREQGPDSGDGATDPSEIESEVVGVAGALPDHVDLGHELFGQPEVDGETNVGGVPVNPGANSHGAGVITPGEDQKVATGPRRNDDRDSAEPALESTQDSGDSGTESDDGGGESFLPPSEIDGPVDTAAADVPDALDLPN